MSAGTKQPDLGYEKQPEGTTVPKVQHKSAQWWYKHRVRSGTNIGDRLTLVVGVYSSALAVIWDPVWKLKNPE